MRELKLKRVYRHFKGDYYLVEDVANDSETGEEYVIYRKLYGDGSQSGFQEKWREEPALADTKWLRGT